MNIEAVRDWAIAAHGNQRYGDLPYAFHLDHVAGTARRFGLVSYFAVAAAYLHDVLEDTDKTADDVEAVVGDCTTEIVRTVTKTKGESRKAYYDRIVLRSDPSIRVDAAELKVCDRIAKGFV